MRKIIGIILKERTLAVGTHKSIPMLVPPIAMFTYAHIAHGNTPAVVNDRYGQLLRTALGRYHRTATIGLLHKGGDIIHHKYIGSIKLRIERYRSQIKRMGEKRFHYNIS